MNDLSEWTWLRLMYGPLIDRRDLDDRVPPAPTPEAGPEAYARSYFVQRQLKRPVRGGSKFLKEAAR